MAMVMFAQVCDRCKLRGPEYDSLHTMQCRECGDEVCRACSVSEESWRKWSEPGDSTWTICKACANRVDEPCCPGAQNGDYDEMCARCREDADTTDGYDPTEPAPTFWGSK